MIEKLIRLLQQTGFNDLEADDVADILWLATHLRLSTEETRTGSKDQSKGNTPAESLPKDSTLAEESKSIDRSLPKSQRLDKPTQITSRNVPAPAGVYVPTDISKSAGGLSFQAPGVAALPDKRQYERALRPFLRRVPSDHQFLLDEEATVHRIADTLTWLPVMRPDLSRWLELDVVVDEWPSLVLWRDSINELITLLTNLGAYRSVQVWSIWTTRNLKTKEADVEFRSGWGSAGAAAFARPPKELVSIRGNRLVFLISDCISPAWYNGAIGRLLSQWTSTEMVVLLQVLPETYWRRTGLAHAIPAYSRMTQPGQPNSRLTLIPDPTVGQPLPPKAIPVPVLPLDPQLIAVWAQAAAGRNNLWVPAVMIPTADPREKLPQKEGGAEGPGATSEKKDKDPLAQAEFLVERFRQSASPEAWKLAVYLSAASPLNLPVMRLIQQTMVSQSRLEHLAEFYLSGLIRRVSSPNVFVEANARYDFAPGVRKILLVNISRAEAADVLRKTTRFVDRNTGKAVNFDAIVADPSLVSQLDLGSAPFAKLSQSILRMLGGDFARLATALADRRLSEETLEQVTAQESVEDVAESGTNLLNTLTEELQGLVASRLESQIQVSSASSVLDALTRLQISITDPRNTLLYLSLDTLEKSGIRPNAAQRQALERADYYYVSLSVRISTPPNTSIGQFQFEVEFEWETGFEPETGNEPLIRSIYPTSEWSSLLILEQELRFGLAADLNWRVETASIQEQPNEKVRARQQGRAAGDKESLLEQKFMFPFSRMDLEATGLGGSWCNWNFNNFEVKSPDPIQFGIIFEVPRGTEKLKIAARAVANPSLNWLTTNLREIISLLGDRLRRSLTAGKNERFAITDFQGGILQLPGAAVAAEPSVIKKKVRVLIYLPDAVRRMPWYDPDKLAQQYIDSLNKLSGGKAQFEVVNSEEIQDYPPFEDGRRYTDATWTQAMADPGKALRSAGGYLLADYQAILNEFNILQEIQTGAVDEVLLFGAPYFGFYESRMVGQDAYWCNGPALQLNSRKFIVMGFNYERGLNEMLHGFGHRVEAILAHRFNSQAFLQMLERTPNARVSEESPESPEDLPPEPQNEFERFLWEHGTIQRKPNEGDYSQNEEAWLGALHEEWWAEVLLHDPNAANVDKSVPASERTWSRLFVRAIGNELLRFTLETRGSITEYELGLQKSNIEALLTQAVGNQQWSQNLGSTLFELMIPNRLAGLLRELDNVLFILEPETAHYPWELLYDRRAGKDRPLFVQVGVIRQFSTDPFQTRVMNVRNNNILVVGDPANLPQGFASLPGAQQEASWVAAKFKQFEYNVFEEIHTLSISIMNRLFANDYRILHLAGHGVYDYSVRLSDQEMSMPYTGIVLGDDVFLTASEIRNKKEIPELVFINCSYSEKLNAIDEPAAYQFNRLAASLSADLLKIGVKAVVTAGWTVNDSAALTFADVFYDHLLQGHTFGDAVRAARAETYELHKDGFNTWAAFQCYGDPAYRLVATTYESS